MRFGDSRLTRRVKKLADALAKNPTSVSQRLCSRPKLTSKPAIDSSTTRKSPPRKSYSHTSKQRIDQVDFALLVQDTTEIDLTHLDATGPDVNPAHRLSNQKGFLSVSQTDYLQLLDWTGREIRQGKRGSIPSHLAPILTRIGMDSQGWCELVRKFGSMFKRAAGTVEHLRDEASRRGLDAVAWQSA